MTPLTTADILERFDGDIELFTAVAESYLDGFSAHKNALQDANKNFDIKSIHFLAHTMRGAASNFSETLFILTARKLEAITATEVQDLKAVSALVDDVLIEGEQLCTMLRAMIETKVKES